MGKTPPGVCWNEWVASSFLRVKSDTDTHHGSVTTPVPYANLDACGILNLIDLICLTSLLYAVMYIGYCSEKKCLPVHTDRNHSAHT